MSKARILVVDDEGNARTALSELLRGEGYVVEMAADGFKALGKLPDFCPDVVLTDLKMPGMDGVELLRKIRAQTPDVCVIVMTAYGAVDSAVAAMKEGAADYLTKPLDFGALTSILKHELEQLRLRRDSRGSGTRLPPRLRLQNVVGDSPGMQEIFKTVAQIAGSPSSVFISGEIGTGKELLAAAIHEHSPRGEGPFVTTHCGALSEAALESELFGHERGAFAGATVRRDGRLARAHRGTLFLDEVGELTAGTQVKLLHFLQEHEFERVGGSAASKLTADVRVVAASHRDLRAEVAAGRFREDLFYRLSVFSIHMPALRERPSDVAPLCRHFLDRYARANRKTIAGFAEPALLALVGYGWPGNVGELENVIERAVGLCDGEWVQPEHLPPQLFGPRNDHGVRIPGTTMEEIERYAITKTLEATGGSTSEAAEMLGISARKIQYKMHEYRSAPKAGVPAVEVAGSSARGPGSLAATGQRPTRSSGA